MNVLQSSVLRQPLIHDTRREGIRLGLIVGTVTWLWVAVVDTVAGQPFRTAEALGGVFVFTSVHYVLNVAYGIALLFAVHRADRAPSLVIAALFCVLTLQGGFGMLTTLLAQLSLGRVAWVGLFGGSLIGTATAFMLLSRTHPLADYLRRAEEEL